MSDIKKFVITVVSLVIGFFAFDRGIAAVCDWMFMHTNGRFDSGLRKIVCEQNADVVLMGSSRTKHHLDPVLMSDSLGMSVYNCGNDGTGDIASQYALFNLVVERHRPRLIVLEVGVSMFMHNTSKTWIPFMGQSAATDSVFMDAGIYNTYKWVRSYRYNTAFVRYMTGLVHASEPSEEDSGFEPLGEVGDPYMKPRRFDYYEAVSPGATYLEKYCKKCQDLGITLILCDSPFYADVPEDIHKPIKRIADKYGVPFLDYFGGGMWASDASKYRDAAHLKGSAAEEFTKVFLRDIKKFL